jgi:peroxiredoxin
MLAVLALLLGACHHPSDPQARTNTASDPQAKAAASKPASTEPPKEPPDEGERLAAIARARRIGTPGPAMTLKTIDGETIDLAKIYGTKPVYLKFWATWCKPCRKQMPGFERIYEAVGDRMQVIAVDAGFNDDEESVRAFRKEYGLRMPIVIDDGRLAAALDLQVTPQHVLIGRDARISFVSHHDGEQLDAAIQKVLAPPGASGPATGQAVSLRPAFRVGDVVQGIEARTLDGTAVPLGRSRDGRPRGLVLFSAWCESYLEKSQPKASQACRRVREEVDQLVVRGDVDWLGIAGGPWSSAADLVEYKSETHTKLPLALDADGALFRAFGVHDIPTIVLIDANGRLARVVGPDDRDLAEAVGALQAQK